MGSSPGSGDGGGARSALGNWISRNGVEVGKQADGWSLVANSRGACVRRHKA